MKEIDSGPETIEWLKKKYGYPLPEGCSYTSNTEKDIHQLLGIIDFLHQLLREVIVRN